MNIFKTTKIFTAIMFIVVAIYDVYAMVIGGTEASISSVIINFSYKMPFFTFLFGVLCGHLFWRMRPNSDTIKENIDKVDK